MKRKRKRYFFPTRHKLVERGERELEATHVPFKPDMSQAVKDIQEESDEEIIDELTKIAKELHEAQDQEILLPG